MKKYISMTSCLIMLSALVACNSDAPKTQSADAPQVASNIDKGKALFQQNCATCHMLNKDMTGPALGGVLARWDNDTERIKAFIRNPSKLIIDKDPSAIKAFEKFPVTMSAFPNLSDGELNDLIAYFQNGH